MKRYTLKELNRMHTIEQGHTDDLKVVIHPMYIISGESRKVWLSRLTVEDGMPYDNMVTVETYSHHDGWQTTDTYPALSGPSDCGECGGYNTRMFPDEHGPTCSLNPSNIQ